MISPETIRDILADGEWTQEIVVAAARALSAYDPANLRADGMTIDGDDPAVSAKTILQTAFAVQNIERRLNLR